MVLESVLTGVGDPTNVAEKDPLVVVKFFFRLEALDACDACMLETPVYVLLKIMVTKAR